MSLPDPASDQFESLAVANIANRLLAHGPPPWSICEARFSEHDVAILLAWARGTTASRLNIQRTNAGLLLISLFSEWNRRRATGESVFRGTGLADLFDDDTARICLFTVNDDPTVFLRTILRDAFSYFSLRHTFTDASVTDHWYQSIQLQYGFSLPHAHTQLPNWLRGHRAPEAIQRLLAADGPHRSASFQRLCGSLKAYRRNYLPESDLRRTLAASPWVLLSWIDELLHIVDGIPFEDIHDAMSVEYVPLDAPRVTWEDGPYVDGQINPLPESLNLHAPRYILRHAGQIVARFFRLNSGGYEVDNNRAQLTLHSATAVVTLEEEDAPHSILAVQEIKLWKPTLFAQTRPIGTQANEVTEYLLGGPQILITPHVAYIDPPPLTWRLVGPRQDRWKWSLLDAPAQTTVSHNGFVWVGQPPPPPPAWSRSVSVEIEPANGVIRLNDPIRFRFNAPAGVEIVHAMCAGKRMSFEDDSRRRSAPVSVTPEMAPICHVRVGVSRQGDAAVVSTQAALRVRAVTFLKNDMELSRQNPIKCFQARSYPIRVISDGPALLLEGREAHETLPIGKATLMGSLLGTGQAVLLADSPFNTDDRFLVAPSSIETGVVDDVEKIANRQTVRLTLHTSLDPRADHRVLLWSPQQGTTFVPVSDITVTDDCRSWTFSVPWQCETLLAAISFQGHCLGMNWFGNERDFFDPVGDDALTAETRLRLIRWCRVPALRKDPNSLEHPLIGRLAPLTVAAIKAALLDTLVVNGQELVCEPRESRKGELFNAIFRHIYLRFPNAVPDALWNELPGPTFDELVAYHPILACRALRVQLPSLRARDAWSARALLTALRAQLLALPVNTPQWRIDERLAKLSGRSEEAFSISANILEGLTPVVIGHVLQSTMLGPVELDNLQTLMRVASFREYLGGILLGQMIGEFE